MSAPFRFLLLAVVVAACRTAPAPRPAVVTEDPGLIVGEFPLAKKKPILDGDTIRVEGLDSTLRLLGIDTEETFKFKKDRDAFAKGWDVYLAEMRGTSKHPVKMATPAGMDALDFAKHFFDGSETVRIERDHPGEIRDFYGRWLAYVFAKHDGKWVNYNVEAVRAGWSPYFVKYGRSRRFHEQFVAAQEEARAAKRGIWSPTIQHYPDYDERLRWWGERDAAVEQFELKMQEKPNHVALTRTDALEVLAKLVGQDVVVFGLVGDTVSASPDGPFIVKLAKDRVRSFEVVFFDPQVLETTGLARRGRDYVEVSGKVSVYQGRPQLVVRSAAQVVTFAQAGAGDDGDAEATEGAEE